MKLDDDPEQLDGKYLGTISEDFVKAASLLKESFYQIKVRKISDYPIAVICRTAQPIGSLLVAAGQMDLTWNYYLSYLDEFVQRGLLEEVEGQQAFIQTYRDPQEYCCLFVVDEKFTQFVYIPYPDDVQEENEPFI
jgi:hypothetical protein